MKVRPGSIWAAEARATTLALITLTVLIAFETYAISTAMPVAAQALGALREFGLASTVFAATSLLGILAAGAWNDRSGPRGPLLSALVVFGAGLVISGTAESFDVLVFGRAVSGLGAGLYMVSVYVLVAQRYRASAHPQVFGVISASWVLPSLIGPVLSGLLATHVSWRAVFLVVPPLLALPTPVLFVQLRRPDVEQESTMAESSKTERGQSLGAVLSAAARLRPGLGSLVAFRAMIAGVFFSAETYIPLMLVTHRGLVPTAAGLALTAGAIGWFLGSWTQARPSFGLTHATLVWLGAALIGLGVAALGVTALASVPVQLVAVVWSVAGLGMGWAMSSSSVLLLRLSQPGGQGRAAAAIQVGDNLGVLAGTSATAAWFAAHHRPGGDDTGVYLGIWLVLGIVGIASVFVARRIVPGAGSARVTCS